MIGTHRRRRCIKIRFDGIVAVVEERPRENRCLLKSLSNLRTGPITAVVAVQPEGEARFTVQPSHKLVFHTPLPVASGSGDLTVAFSTDPSEREEPG